MIAYRRLVMSILVLALSACAPTAEVEWILAQPCANKPPGAKDIGVVLLHGKQGAPMSGFVAPMQWALQGAGYMVEAPSMPWHFARNYDRTYEDAMKEIDDAVEKLKRKGARRIVVAGHSLGGNGALGYAATRKGLAGVIPIAPGHEPERGFFAQKVGTYAYAARRLVEQGRGKERDDFLDANEGKWFTVRVPAEVYVSYFASDGPAVMPKNAAAIAPGTPVLWIEASGEVHSVLGPNYAFNKIPPHPKSAFVYVYSDHLSAMQKSDKVVIAWLNCL